MKITFITLMLSSFLVSISALGWVADVFFIQGQVRSYDKKEVRIKTASEQMIIVPREAVPKEFKLSTLEQEQIIPIETALMGAVRSVRKPASANTKTK